MPGGAPTGPQHEADAHTTAQAPVAQAAEVNVLLVMSVIVSTAFVMMLNETSIAVVLPAIMEEFTVTAAVAQWLITGVMLTMAVLMPATGWILGRFRTRTVFLTAVGAFLIGTVLAAVSPTFSVMLGGRVFQAIGTALILPLQLTLVMTLVPAHRRGTVMGIIAVVMAVGPALGPTFGGLMMSLGSWHLIFLALVPLVAASLLFGLVKLVNVSEQRRTPLDVLSLVLAGMAFGGIIYGLSSIGQVLEGDPLAIGAPVVGVVLLVIFLVRQVRLGEKALLNLAPLTMRNYVLALAVVLLLHFALLGVANLLPLYLQGALLTTALVAGLVNLPGGVLETVLSPLAGAAFDRIGPRWLVVPGVTIMAVSMFWMATDSAATPVWVVVVQFTALSVGLALALTPLFTSALGTVPKHLYSHGSAILNTLLQVAMAAGTAVCIAVFSYRSEAGGNTPEAIAQGATTSFLLVAVLTSVAAVLGFFVRKPANTQVGEVLGH